MAACSAVCGMGCPVRANARLATGPGRRGGHERVSRAVRLYCTEDYTSTTLCMYSTHSALALHTHTHTHTRLYSGQWDLAACLPATAHTLPCTPCTIQGLVLAVCACKGRAAPPWPCRAAQACSACKCSHYYKCACVALCALCVLRLVFGAECWLQLTRQADCFFLICSLLTTLHNANHSTLSPSLFQRGKLAQTTAVGDGGVIESAAHQSTNRLSSDTAQVDETRFTTYIVILAPHTKPRTA